MVDSLGQLWDLCTKLDCAIAKYLGGSGLLVPKLLSSEKLPHSQTDYLKAV